MIKIIVVIALLLAGFWLYSNYNEPDSINIVTDHVYDSIYMDGRAKIDSLFEIQLKYFKVLSTGKLSPLAQEFAIDSFYHYQYLADSIVYHTTRYDNIKEIYKDYRKNKKK
jgi:hypothetical protein